MQVGRARILYLLLAIVSIDVIGERRRYGSQPIGERRRFGCSPIMDRFVSFFIAVGTLVVALVAVLAVGIVVGAALYLLQRWWRYAVAALLVAMTAAVLYGIGRFLTGKR
jgi:hypothetical protein